MGYMTPVREVLIQSGMWEDVVDIISERIMKFRDEYRSIESGRVDIYGMKIQSVEMSKVREGVMFWMKLIEINDTDAVPYDDSELLESFSIYIESILDLNMNKYAYASLYGRDVNEKSIFTWGKPLIEYVKTLRVLLDSIEYFYLGEYEYENDGFKVHKALSKE